MASVPSDSLESSLQRPGYLQIDIDASVWKSADLGKFLNTNKISRRKGSIGKVEDNQETVKEKPLKTLWESLSKTQARKILPLSNLPERNGKMNSDRNSSAWSHHFLAVGEMMRQGSTVKQRRLRNSEEKLRFTPMRQMASSAHTVLKTVSYFGVQTSFQRKYPLMGAFWSR